MPGEVRSGFHFAQGLVHGFHALGGAGLDGADGVAHIVGGGHGLFGQLAHLVRHHGKAASGLAGAGGLNGGVEGQQVGLVGNVRNDVHDSGDGLGVLVELVHILLEGL